MKALYPVGYLPRLVSKVITVRQQRICNKGALGSGDCTVDDVKRRFYSLSPCDPQSRGERPIFPRDLDSISVPLACFARDAAASAGDRRAPAQWRSANVGDGGDF